MIRGRTWVLLIIIVIFAFALWVLLPIEGERLGRKGIQFGLDLEGGVRLVYQADLSQVEPGTESDVIDGVIAVITNRINPLGVTEPNIEKRGDNQIVVEIPQLSITDVQRERIGRTALLEFRELLAVEVESEEEPEVEQEGEGEEEPPVEQEGEGEEEPEVVMEWVPATGVINGQEKVLNSSYFKSNTYISRDEFGAIELIFEWNEEGAILSEQITGRLVGQPLGIFEGDEPLLDENDRPVAPTVQAVIRDRGRITGLSLNEATELSKQLNAGRLPVPLESIGGQEVDPTLGADFVELSVKAGIIGIALVMLFMIFYYRLPGVIASLALIFYGTLVLALFKLIPVTLTLAGIGGFVLSIGMAVDANVLIFERMKEEFRTGQTLGATIEAGFDRAWTAIRDSNVTTFIVCLVLYWVGNSIAFGGSVKGFALTLFIGVAVSMFTAIVVTRTFLRLFVGTNLARRTSIFTSFSGRK
jgi:preprotein translocase subunit SecD